MILVFDLGASRTRIALAQDGELGKVVYMETDVSTAGFAKFLGVLEVVAGEHKLQAVIGGMPVQLEGEEGRIVLARNLPEWLGIPVSHRIAELFDCPSYITNDVILGGLGECHGGAGSPKGVMAYFTVSTGVNAVRIVDGRVDDSISRYEIGGQLIQDRYGRTFTLESQVSGAALEKKFGRLPADIESKSVWKEVDRDLAVGLYDTVIHWDPELIVLGGSMMNDIDLTVVGKELRRLAGSGSRVPRLVRAKRGDLVGLYGALAWYEQIQHND